VAEGRNEILRCAQNDKTKTKAKEKADSGMRRNDKKTNTEILRLRIASARCFAQDDGVEG
jgi:hypothetical protein